MQGYTLGFVFDTALKRVLLIGKRRPAWQAGHLNGVGGKLEPGEAPLDGIRREVWEESGLDIGPALWTPVGAMTADDWRVDVFAAIHDGDPAAAQSRTDEPVGWYAVDALPPKVLDNLRWLVPLCVDRLQHHTPGYVLARY